MLSDEDILRGIEGGETRRVEFKSARLFGLRHQRAEVQRAVFAMANQRDGGVVLIGVNDDGIVPGLTAEEANSWSNEQSARQSFAASCQPAVDFDLSIRTLNILGEPRTVAVIEVREFDEFPIICTRDVKTAADQILRDGATYVRNLIPPSVPIADHSQMRELLDLAIEKGVRRFLRTAGRAGLTMTEEQVQNVVQLAVATTLANIGGIVPVPAPQPSQPDDAAEFDQQREGFDGE
jgi:hypothetical protein